MKALAGRFHTRIWALPILYTLFMVVALIGTMVPTATYARDSTPIYSDNYYIVRRGDTLRNIAIAYGTTEYEIARANGLRDVNRIEVGQRLTIPGTYSGNPMPAQNSQPCSAYHYVRHGENVTTIAQWYSVDAFALAKANGVYNLNHLYAGQTLCIPMMGQGQSSYHQAPVYQKPVHGKPAYHAPQVYPTATPIVLPTPHSQYAPGNAPLNYDPWAKDDGYQHRPHSYAPPRHDYPTPTPKPAQPVIVHSGWTGTYYAHTQCGGEALYTRQDNAINFDWGTGGPGGGLSNDYFSVAWTTDAHFTAGSYRFYATVDDGIRVYVDNQLVIDAWREQPTTTFSGDIWLSEGYHHVRVEYFEQAGFASVRVDWGKL